MGEGVMGKRKKAGGQIPGEPISHRSHRSSRDKKKEIAASDGGGAGGDGYQLPLHCERRITGGGGGGGTGGRLLRGRGAGVLKRTQEQPASDVDLYKNPTEY